MSDKNKKEPLIKILQGVNRVAPQKPKEEVNVAPLKDFSPSPPSPKDDKGK